MRHKFQPMSHLLLILLCISLPSFAGHSEQHTNQSLKKSLKSLSTYNQLKSKLRLISKWSKSNITTGPLIINNDNQGLINIDIPLNTELPIYTGVCGENNLTPTVREAVVCTVNDQLGGNTIKSNVGFSTQKRELLAAQLGNSEGTRVMVITQQHGNEPAATEAVIKILYWFSLSKHTSIQNILDTLNILVVVRANPDGGEPNYRRCAITPSTGEVITQDCAMSRQNVDPHAGGGFLTNSEADFNGVVGQGYDLNRYHYISLTSPIRPVETQALVATALAFNPEVVLDLHGDLHKTNCQIDFSSINPGQVLGLLPTAE